MARPRTVLFGCLTVALWLGACSKEGQPSAPPIVPPVASSSQDLLNCNLAFPGCASQGQPCSAQGGPGCCQAAPPAPQVICEQIPQVPHGGNCCPQNALLNGAVCAAFGPDPNCCSGQCSQNKTCCSNLGQGCDPAQPGDCCQNGAQNGAVCGGELNVCCMPQNKPCMKPSDCCSGFCNNGSCGPPAGGPVNCLNCNQCAPNAPFCEDGHCTCEPNGFSCNVNNPVCCSGNCEPGPNPVCCMLPFAPCLAAEDCCTGSCLPGVLGQSGNCKCLADGTASTDARLCCHNLLNPQGACTCTARNANCAGNPGSCCDGLSCSANGICLVANGQACPNGDADCASGDCQDSNVAKVCVANTTVGLGGVCSDPADCPSEMLCNPSNGLNKCCIQKGSTLNRCSHDADCCAGLGCSPSGTCLVANGQACPNGDADCASGDCQDSNAAKVCVANTTVGLGGLCSDQADCPSEMLCNPSGANKACCIKTGSLANVCTLDSDCCTISVPGNPNPVNVRCKDGVCQNDLDGGCRMDSDVDCAPGNVCINNLCWIEAEAIHCNNNWECESNDCNYPTCVCVLDNLAATNSVSCCNGNPDGKGICRANTTRGQACGGVHGACTAEESCINGTCCIPHTSREQGTKVSDCCDGTYNPGTKECCSPVAGTSCTYNEDCCQGMICDTDLKSPVCRAVLNNPCTVPSDCLHGTCNPAHVCK